MRYLLLIYGSEAAQEGASDEERAAMFEAYMAFDREIVAGGHKLGGEALQPTATATTVQVRDGRTLTTDGPFAETKEQLGGYYLIDAPDLDAALEAASKIPAARGGTIEVRPIMSFG